MSYEWDRESVNIVWLLRKLDFEAQLTSTPTGDSFSKERIVKLEVSSFTTLFEAWCNKHGKTYSSVEEKQRRLEIFEDNHSFVKQHNELGNSSYSLSLNTFADLNHHEFKASHLGLAATPTMSSSLRKNVGDPSREVVRDIPASKDWRKEEQ